MKPSASLESLRAEVVDPVVSSESPPTRLGNETRSTVWENVETPRIAVIITHHNYSDHLHDCVLSVLKQTYGKVDTIVVDDCSDADHLSRASQILDGMTSDKVRFIRNAVNKGQVRSFYDGLDQTDADFVVLLDPDDRLHPDFCREMLGAHLNSDIYCGQASCNQIFVRNNVMLTGTTGHRRPVSKDVYKVDPEFRLTYVGPHLKGWHWPSTSSLVFRRDAVELLRPTKDLQTMRAADAYFAPLIHMIGGSLYYSKPLVLRNFHAGNSWLPERIVSRLTTQNGKHKTGEFARIEALDAFFSNGHSNLIERDALRTTLRANLNKEQRRQLSSMHGEVAQLLETVRRGPLRHWLREFRHGARARLRQIKPGRSNG